MKWIDTNLDGFQSIAESLFLDNSNDNNCHIRTITIQVTDECNCACTYCYQRNKSTRMMTKQTAKNIIDYIIEMWYHNDEDSIINKNTFGIVLDFIGGEPMLNLDVIDYTCDYFWTRCISENIPWKDMWSGSISTNGSLYFDQKFQSIMRKYYGHFSCGITVDGPQEIHDSCRLYKDGSGGNFKDAYAALLHLKNNYMPNPGTKITIAPENLKYLNTITKFFFDNDIYIITGNVVFEHEWTIEEAQTYYYQLKQLADNMLIQDKSISVSFFNQSSFCKMSPDNNRNWCGGTGAMLAFDPDGLAYPCLRYMSSSLGDDQPPICIGDCTNGIYKSAYQKQIKADLDSITRRSQSTDECFYCQIANGCAWCSGWNYQETGTVNKRSTRICNSHKARSLANVYFWNKYYIQENIPKYFHKYLSDAESLKFISQDELNLLNSLEEQAKNRNEDEVIRSNTIEND